MTSISVQASLKLKSSQRGSSDDSFVQPLALSRNPRPQNEAFGDPNFILFKIPRPLQRKSPAAAAR